MPDQSAESAGTIAGPPVQTPPTPTIAGLQTRIDELSARLNTPTADAAGEKCPCEAREKYWSELTPDEKIERLREQVKSVMALLSDQAGTLERARTILMQHTHNPIGELMVPAKELSQFQHNLNSIWRNKPGLRKDDQVYF